MIHYANGRGRRDTIQISLGSTANAITAHLLNLQGLAATTSGDNGHNNDAALCDIQTTHHVQDKYWVPRTLIVDEPTRYFVAPQISDACLRLQQQQLTSFFSVETITDPNLTLQHEEPKWDSILSNASMLAYASSHSRYYHQEEEEPTKYKASQSNPRHVVWDDDEDEEEESEIEDPHDRKIRLQQQYNNWNQNIRSPIQQKLSDQANSPELFDETYNFMDFFMPPYSPKSLLSLPYSNQSNLTANWNTYHNTDSIIKEWKEDTLFEGLRRLLEESDGCQGVSILTEGSGLYAGLTTSLLHELQEECSSAGRIVYHVTNPKQHPSNDAAVDTEENQENVKDSSSSSSWHGIHVDRLRQNIGSGFALHDFCHNAHAVLPLQLPSNITFFEATATLAMALEASTLPIRLFPRNDPRYQIGLQNVPFFGGNDTSWGSRCQSLSVSELLQCLQPSSQYPVLELDALLPSTKQQNRAEHLWDKLSAGTSLERDQRMRESGRDGQLRRPQDTAPGLWLDDVRHGGILQSLSQKNDGANGKISSRSLHHHFALGVSIRAQLQDDLSNYSTCIVQGMGIRYRPERSMSAVLNQTISQLTHNGGGAGSYWGRLMDSSANQPVVAVVGNTTRMYPYLEKISSEFKSVLGTRYKGYYQRDLMNGVLPEIEDCEEALADCLDIRDKYHPPDGSGLVDDDDGEDFL